MNLPDLRGLVRKSAEAPLVVVMDAVCLTLCEDEDGTEDQTPTGNDLEGAKNGVFSVASIVAVGSRRSPWIH